MTASDAPSPEAVHLHLDDYPEALRLLGRLLSRRTDHERLGYLATEHGAWVDWQRLTTTAPLSSTEVAAVHIARGCAGLERAGGAGPLAEVVADVVRAVV